MPGSIQASLSHSLPSAGKLIQQYLGRGEASGHRCLASAIEQNRQNGH